MLKFKLESDGPKRRMDAVQRPWVGAARSMGEDGPPAPADPVYIYMRYIDMCFLF